MNINSPHISLFSLPSLNSMIQKHLSSLRPGTCLRRNWTNARYKIFWDTSITSEQDVHIFELWIAPVQIKDAFISDGCLLRECNIKHSVIGVCSRVGSGCELMVHTLPRCMLIFYILLHQKLIWATRIMAPAFYILVYHIKTRVHKMSKSQIGFVILE